MQPVDASVRRAIVQTATEKFFSPFKRKILYPPEFHRRRLKRLMRRGEFG